MHPGRFCGIPTLMVAPVVTPYLRRTARRCGYLAAISATIPPRMLYRRIGPRCRAAALVARDVHREECSSSDFQIQRFLTSRLCTDASFQLGPALLVSDSCL